MRSLIGLIRAMLVLPLLAAPLPAFADPYTDNAAIDELFTQLLVASNEMEADEISRQIWAYWFTPSEPELARRMAIAGRALGMGDTTGALVELNSVV